MTKVQKIKNLWNVESNNKGLQHFINEFAKRHLDVLPNYYCSPYVFAGSESYAREWETKSFNWFDISEKVFPEDKFLQADFMLENKPIDKFGYVWTSMSKIENSMVRNPGRFAQGWPFPYGGSNNGETHFLKHFIPEYEFNEDMQGKEGFDCFVDGFLDTENAKIINGYFNVDVENCSEIRFSSPNNLNISTFISPFLHLEFKNTLVNIEDMYIEYKIAGDINNYIISQKEFNTLPIKNLSNIQCEIYMAMFLSKGWKPEYEKFKLNLENKIDSIDIVFKAKKNCKMKGNMSINYLRFECDKRQINNQYILICSVKNLYEFIGDNKYLENKLPRLRRAMQFYLTNCNGVSGLIDCDWFIGHGGVREEGNGIGNGYWDIQCMPSKAFYTNVCFYKTLLAMIFIEEIAEKNNLKCEDCYIMGKDNKTSIKYSQNSQTLKILAEKCKLLIEKEFWNEETKRFSSGYDENNQNMDCGYTVFNLEALETGIGTKMQAKNILDWINGDRIIESDDCKGKDIYKYVFAPIINTKDNSNYLFWAFNPVEYGKQLQNGGAVLYLAYYDIISRLKVYGIENAYSRLENIISWYLEVEKAGGNGFRFYRDYYEKKDQAVILEGWEGNGQIGIDHCFLESSILLAMIPKMFFDLKAIDDCTLSISPILPKSLTKFKMNNCLFKGVRYDIEINHDKLIISNVFEYNSLLKIIIKNNKKELITKLENITVNLKEI